MNELIFLVEEEPSGGYTARALGASIFTEGDTREQVWANVREAVEVYYPDAQQRPRLVRLHYVHDEVFSL